MSSAQIWAIIVYIPRSLVGGPGWGVWDQKANRFLKDGEVKRMSATQLDERWVQ